MLQLEAPVQRRHHNLLFFGVKLSLKQSFMLSTCRYIFGIYLKD